MTQLDMFTPAPEPYVRACTCRPGVRCEPCRHVSHASQRMFRLCRIWGHDARRQPVQHADQTTSLCDARTALCITIGVDLDDIDPVTGHDRRSVA